MTFATIHSVPSQIRMGGGLLLGVLFVLSATSMGLKKRRHGIPMSAMTAEVTR